MPHDVTMPQLGMAQDAGRIVAWLKSAGRRGCQGRCPVRGRNRQGHDGGRGAGFGLLDRRSGR